MVTYIVEYLLMEVHDNFYYRVQYIFLNVFDKWHCLF